MGGRGGNGTGTHLKAPNDDKALNVKLSDVGTDLFEVLLGQSPNWGWRWVGIGVGVGREDNEIWGRDSRERKVRGHFTFNFLICALFPTPPPPKNTHWGSKLPELLKEVGWPVCSQ